MFYRSGLWSLMCSWWIRVMLSEQMYTLTRNYASRFFPFCTTSATHSHSSPSSLFPCWAVCHSGEVRHHVILQWCVECIQGPQALDDNQPNLSHRFSTAWKIHRPICQTWNGLLHSLEFHCCPQTTSLNVTQFLLLGERAVKPPLLSPLLFHLTGPVSSLCMLITGNSFLWWSERLQCWWK